MTPDKDTSPIFHTLPAAKEEFWGEKPHGTLRTVRGIGRAAARAADITGSLITLPPLFAGEVAMRGSETLWRSVDKIAANKNMPIDSRIREQAERHGSAARHFAWVLKRARQNTLLHLEPRNPNWENRFYTMAEEDLDAARKADTAGDHRLAKQHMRNAHVNKVLHTGRQ